MGTQVPLFTMTGILGFVSRVSTRLGMPIKVAPSQRTPTLSGPFCRSRSGTGCAKPPQRSAPTLPWSSWVSSQGPRVPSSVLGSKRCARSLGSVPFRPTPGLFWVRIPRLPLLEQPRDLTKHCDRFHLPTARPPQEQHMLQAVPEPYQRTTSDPISLCAWNGAQTGPEGTATGRRD